MGADTTPLATHVTERVPATLVVRPEFGDERPATAETLRAMGWDESSDVDRRINQVLALIVTGDREADLTRGPHEASNALRYLLEVAVCHERDVDEIISHVGPKIIEEVRAMLVAGDTAAAELEAAEAGAGG